MARSPSLFSRPVVFGVAIAVVVVATVIIVLSSGSGDEPSASNPTSPPGAANPTSPPAAAGSLDGQRFASSSVQGRDLAEGSELTLNFADGRLVASAGCNTSTGGYAFEDGRLQQQDAASTLMGCEGALEEQERWFFALLAEGVGAEYTQGRVTLKDDAVTMIFDPADPSGPAPIIGTKWELIATSERGGDLTQLPAGVKPATLDLTDPARLALFTGCNRGGGTVKEESGFLIFGPIATTRMACRGAADELERHVLSVIDGKVAIAYDGDRNLVLAKDGNSLTFRAVP